MWDYFLQDWHLRLQHNIQTDRPVWCRDEAGVQSMLAADQVALSASEIRSQHEMVVLSHLQSGSMDGGCKRRLIIVGIGGMSGAGKSTLAKLLCRHLRAPYEPLQTDHFRKRSDDPTVPKTEFAWHGPDGQDLVAFREAVIEVAYVLLTSPDGEIHPTRLITPHYSVCMLRTNKKWATLQSGKDATVVLCLEGFVLFDDVNVVNLCHYLVSLDVDVETACLQRLRREHGFYHNETTAARFKKYYEVVVKAHESRLSLISRNISQQRVVRCSGRCSRQKRVEQILTAIRLFAAFQAEYRLEDDLQSRNQLPGGVAVEG